MSGYALTWALIAAGDLTAADPVCAATLARCREVGDLWTVAVLLPGMVLLDLEAGRIRRGTLRRTCGRRLNSIRAAAAGSGCTRPWTAAGTCAPPQAGSPRPSRYGPRSPRSNGTTTSRTTR